MTQTMLTSYLNFAQAILVPGASRILVRIYENYCANADIEVRQKTDASPVTAADRDTETFLCNKIMGAYPEHGIVGEEFGAYQADSEYVWVLDPLDGTREFLKKNRNGWGLLIALCRAGKPVLGVISQPLENKTWHGFLDDPLAFQSNNATIDLLKDARIACTDPNGMFGGELSQKIQSILTKAKEIQTGKSCFSFTALLDNTADLVIENNLGFYDIAPLFPILIPQGVRCLTLEGEDYATLRFGKDDMLSRRYGIIASLSPALISSVLEIIMSKEAL